MAALRISGALLERLGEPGAVALSEALEAHETASTETAMTQCGERFERRLIEETSKLRLETAQLGGDMREGFATLRQGMVADRFELLRWAFAFWVGQLAAITAIVGLLLRATR
jgi:hypothetical protein